MTRRKSEIDRSFFDDMLGEVEAARAPVQSAEVALEQIRPRTSQFRRAFDEAGIEALAASIRDLGLLEPIVVRAQGDGFEIVAGERRYRALRSLGRESAPVRVVAFSDAQAELAGAVENLSREDLTPLEEADAVLTVLRNALRVSQGEAVALITRVRSLELGERQVDDDMAVAALALFKQLGYTSVNSFYANRLALLGYPDDLLQAMRDGNLEYTKARVLARVKDSAVRVDLLATVRRENLSVEELERRVRGLLETHTSVPELYEEFGRVKRRITRTWVAQLDTAKQKRLRKLLKDIDTLLENRS